MDNIADADEEEDISSATSSSSFNDKEGGRLAFFFSQGRAVRILLRILFSGSWGVELIIETAFRLMLWAWSAAWMKLMASLNEIRSGFLLLLI